MRLGMTAHKYNFIKDNQLPDREKQKRADFVIKSGLGKRETLRAVRKIITHILRRSKKNV